MPKPGFKTITVPEKLHKSLKKSAEKHKRTVPKEIERLQKLEKEES